MIAGTAPAELTRELRRSVMRPQLAITDQLPGDEVPDAVHFGVRDEDGSIIGACFIAPRPCPWRAAEGPAWVLRQMAARPDRRTAGVGSALLGAVVDFVGTPALIWCHARSTAAGFYERRGFAIDGAEYVDAETGLPHRHMSRQLRDG